MGKYLFPHGTADANDRSPNDLSAHDRNNLVSF